LLNAPDTKKKSSHFDNSIINKFPRRGKSHFSRIDQKYV
jgi:hypothetical protein